MGSAIDTRQGRLPPWPYAKVSGKDADMAGAGGGSA